MHKLPIIRQGFGLIEVVIAIVLISVGLLGFANLQQKSMLSLKKSDNTSTAAVLAAEMVNKINANIVEAKKAANSAYLHSYASLNDTLNGFITNNGDKANDANYLNNNLSNNCFKNAGCSSQQQAVMDLLTWKAMLKQSLPNGRGVICFDSNPVANKNSLNCDNSMVNQNNTISYIVKILWDNLVVAGSTESYITSVAVYQ